MFCCLILVTANAKLTMERTTSVTAAHFCLRLSAVKKPAFRLNSILAIVMPKRWELSFWITTGHVNCYSISFWQVILIIRMRFENVLSFIVSKGNLFVDSFWFSLLSFPSISSLAMLTDFRLMEDTPGSWWLFWWLIKNCFWRFIKFRNRDVDLLLC